jgi:beta-galactosidase
MTQRALTINLLTASMLITQLAATAQTMPLAGQWRFALDRSAEQTTGGATTPDLNPGDGITQEWFKRDLADRITLPGILQAQGYGNEISPTTPWVVALGDAWWKLQPAALRDRFSHPGHVEVPFLSQPERHYLGAAWYQRDLDIPAAAQGRHFKLFLERAHWQTTVWLDDHAYAPNDSLVAPHITDLGVLAPGKHRLTIRIDNRTQLPAVGHLVDGHSVSDALGATWNGIVGRIELQSTPPVWIEDVQVFPNVAKKSATVRVKIGNATGRSGTGNLFFGGSVSIPNSNPNRFEGEPFLDGQSSSFNVVWNESGGQAQIELPLTKLALEWSEFHPSVYSLFVSLGASPAADSRTVTFGLREVTANDKDLLINGRVVNLRMTHFGGDFPLTGAPATDVASWKRIIKVCQDYGLNGMRFHSWCPPEAAFAAADEMGFYLQPECGMWNNFTSPAMQERLRTESSLLLKAYGNHPSFILLSPSNEPAGDYANVTPRWAAEEYAKDPRRLYSAGTGWASPAQVNGGAQYASLVSFNRTELRNAGGWFGRDYRAAVESLHLPVLAHEVGQWCSYPDFDVIKEFTGFLRPGNYHIFQYIAGQTGVLGQNHALAWASGRFQLACYKEEIEANLRTPGLSGYQLLDLHDYLGQGTALIGLVDAFWQPKSYVTAAEFRRFNSATVPLARLAQRIFTTAEKLTCGVQLYHFGENPLPNATPYWKITDSSGHAVASGRGVAGDIPIGWKNLPIGQVFVDLSKLVAPAAYKLVVGIEQTSVENDWNFWLYPAPVDASTPADVLMTGNWPDAEARLAAGGKVLFTPGAADLDPAKSPPMKRVPVFWNIQMTVRPPRNRTPRFDAMLGLLCDAKHPALAEFPTEANCDWQWTPLVDDVRSVNLTDAPRELKPIVAAIDDWNRNWRLGVIFECKVGPGRLLVSVIDLQKPGATAGAQQLRRSLLDYMASAKFQPAVALLPAQVRQLWSASAASAPAVVPRVFDPDLNDGTGPAPTAK